MTFMWESTRNGGQWPNFFVFVICPKLLDQKNLKLPKTFGHKWKLSSTFIRCLQLLSRVRIPKMSKNFKHQDFSEFPIVLARNEKNKSTFITFPSRLKFSKLSEIFPNILEKNLMNISKHRICWIPKFFSKNENFSTYIICLKYIGQNKDSKTNGYFSSILRNVLREFSRMTQF